MKFRPLHDRVVVKRIDAEAKSAGGIIIPDTAKEKPSQGEVTAIGPGGPRRGRQTRDEVPDFYTSFLDDEPVRRSIREPALGS